jgi:hypothetical protein
MIINHKNPLERYERSPQYGRQINVEEKLSNNLTQAFSDLAWLRQDRREYHPMFIASKFVS